MIGPGTRHLVVGGTRGIGRATVLALAATGADIIFCGRDAVAGAAVCSEVRHGTARFVAADVTDPKDVRRLFAEVERDGAVHGAFNCAGVIGADTPLAGRRFHDSAEAEFDRVMELNVKALWRCLREELRLMTRSGTGGAVVNCASVGGLRSADSRSTAYTTSKHAVVGMTRSLAVEYAGDGIRVNAVCPGVIDTDLLGSAREKLRRELIEKNPGARLGDPREVADVVVFLLSDASSYVSGTTLIVDAGGLTGAL